MIQKNKELLLKDLCARLSYGVICEDGYGNALELNSINKPNTVTFKCSDKTFWTTDLDKCKPYLFPLSSMTEEQKMFLRQQNWCIAISTSGTVETTIEGFDWLNKNHFDYRGLIEKGLAIDATNLNIY